MMTESTNGLPSSKKLTRLDIYFVINKNEENNEILLKNLPRWTVLKYGKEYQIREGIELVEDALAKRFQALESEDLIMVSIALDLQIINS